MQRADFYGYTEKDIAQLVLADLERRRDLLTAKMAETQEILNGSKPKIAKKKHHMSKEGRAAVALAQKRRWARIRREKRLEAAIKKATGKPKEKPAAE